MHEQKLTELIQVPIKITKVISVQSGTFPCELIFFHEVECEWHTRVAFLIEGLGKLVWTVEESFMPMSMFATTIRNLEKALKDILINENNSTITTSNARPN